MVMMWDDHESANDSWTGGAENHDPAKEGPWPARTAAARRAYGALGAGTVELTKSSRS